MPAVRILQTESMIATAVLTLDMQSQNQRPRFKILWEHIGDPNAEELFRQAIALIFDDPQELSPEVHFDKDSLTGLNEGVPVENANQSKLNQ
jgi:hypothetical protein